MAGADTGRAPGEQRLGAMAPPAALVDLLRREIGDRLTAEERLRLESRASQAGYRSLSDYVRAAALRADADSAA